MKSSTSFFYLVSRSRWRELPAFLRRALSLDSYQKLDTIEVLHLNFSIVPTSLNATMPTVYKWYRWDIALLSMYFIEHNSLNECILIVGIIGR